MTFPSCRIAVTLVLALGFPAACDSEAPLEPGPLPQGPAPEVAFSRGFGDAPLDEVLYLRLPEGSTNWEYSVDLDEDGEPEHDGRLTRDLGFRFRFESPGVYRIRVELTGADGTEQVVERAVAVADPALVHVLAERQISTSSSVGFEGITISPDGADLYVGDFQGGIVHRLRASDLASLDSVSLGYGVEGLSVSPSGDYLMLADKYPSTASRLALPDLEPAPAVPGPPGKSFFVHALDDQRALLGGDWQLELDDIPAVQRIAVARRPDGTEFYSGHFNVSESGDRVVVVDGATLRVFSVPSLQILSAFEPPDLHSVYEVVYAADDTRIYVLGWSGEQWVFLTLDSLSGEVLTGFPLAVHCVGYCVANPVARSRDGRLVAMETLEQTLIVDTEVDVPVTGVAGGMSVAADPTADRTFYLLNTSGLVRRVRIDP